MHDRQAVPHCMALIPAVQPSWCLTPTQGHPAGTEASPPAVQLFCMLPAEDAADAQATDASRKKRKVSVSPAVISRTCLLPALQASGAG